MPLIPLLKRTARRIIRRPRHHREDLEQRINELRWVMRDWRKRLMDLEKRVADLERYR